MESDPSDMNWKEHYQPVDHFQGETLFIYILLSVPDDSKSELYRISQTGSSEPSRDTGWKRVLYVCPMSLVSACHWARMQNHLVTTQTERFKHDLLEVCMAGHFRSHNCHE